MAGTLPRDVVEAVVVAAAASPRSSSSCKPPTVLTWHLDDFTVSFCVLRTLKVQVKENGRPCEKSYIVKQTPATVGDPFESYRTRAFLKEAFFYQTLVPALNGILLQASGPKLRVPACYYVDVTPGQEIIIMEDMRCCGYKPSSKWLMDKAHALLVMAEVARLHAASLIMQQTQQPFDKLYPLLQESWTIDEALRAPFQGMVEAGCTQMASMFCKSPGLLPLKEWLQKVSPVALRVIMHQLLQSTTPEFRVITHGDLHSRNVLFKYDAAGSPIDVMMVDLQVIRFSSLAVDVGYFSHFSVLSEVRTQIFPAMLDNYYSSFQSVVENQGMATPFTREQLAQEVTNNKTGLFEAMCFLPVAVAGKNAADCFRKKDEREAVEKMQEKTEEPVNDDTDTLGAGRRDEIISVLHQLAEEMNAMKIPEQYADVEMFTWAG